MRLQIVLLMCTVIMVLGVYEDDFEHDDEYNNEAPFSQRCTGLTMVTRAQWKARRPKSVTRLKTPVKYFFIHHTATPTCTTLSSCSSRVRSIQNYHMDTKGWSDIGYSFLAGEDGRIYKGRGWRVVGAHTRGYNSRSLAVSFIGNYMSRRPNSKAINAAKALLRCGVQLNYMINNYDLLGHRDVGKTTFPGDALYRYIRTWPHYNRTSLAINSYLIFEPFIL